MANKERKKNENDKKNVCIKRNILLSFHYITRKAFNFLLSGLFSFLHILFFLVCICPINVSSSSDDDDDGRRGGREPAAQRK